MGSCRPITYKEVDLLSDAGCHTRNSSSLDRRAIRGKRLDHLVSPLEGVVSVCESQSVTYWDNKNSF